MILVLCNFSYAQTKSKFTLDSFKINLTESSTSTSYLETYANLKWNSNLVNKDKSSFQLYQGKC